MVFLLGLIASRLVVTQALRIIHQLALTETDDVACDFLFFIQGIQKTIHKNILKVNIVHIGKDCSSTLLGISEIVFPVVFLLSWVNVENPWIVFLIIIACGILSIVDYFCFIIPDILTFAVIAFLGINTYVNYSFVIWEQLFLMTPVAFVFLIIGFFVKNRIGFGDTKLIAGACLFLGPMLTGVVFVFASASGFLLHKFFIMEEDIDESGERRFCFGPCLAIGIVLACILQQGLTVAVF